MPGEALLHSPSPLKGALGKHDQISEEGGGGPVAA
jgi:hypothetical protein